MRTLLSLSLLGLLLVGCGQSAGRAVPTATDGPSATSTVAHREATRRAVDVATLQHDLSGGAVPLLVDVRTSAEYDSGHVAQAIHIPLDELSSRLGELEPYRNGEIYLICRSGNRSGQAQQLLAAEGFSTVNVEGGTSAWIAAGMPVQ